MEWLGSLFLGAFLFGLLFCLASLVLGLGHFGIGHHGLHGPGLHGGAGHGLDGGHGPGGGGHGGGAQRLGSAEGPQAPTAISPWNLTGLTAFVAWFGGVGYLALTGWELAAWLCLLLAAAAGLVGWAIIYLFFNRVLVKGERWLDPADYRLEGTVARVTVPIASGRTGEIQYTLGGVRHSDGARSADGSDLERGAEVVVVRYERGIAYVEPWQQFVGGEASTDP